MSALLAAVLAGAAVVLWCPPLSLSARAGRQPAVPPRWPAGVPWGRRRETARTQAAVLEVCDLLAAELAVGRPPGAALASAAERWPPLTSVVEAARLGADVPDAMRRLAAEWRGASDLRWVAGAWQVAQDSGHGLASALERTAGGLRARRRTRRLVDSELASARATARLVACLPLAVLLMGSGAGGSPWAFLLATPMGGACLVTGVGLIGLGLWWIERLADRAASP
ncbi:type II secretion system F family protein [Nocardioides sp. S-58]|uniref:Type II secretion system F family protein n=1 Tax=Nocardioides renjunii TaxID=3095075 RepID=A0ABU5KGZ5_9ACTN|nr:type II secretion system F family protein [Nocardioides sp. S-58]MDZ5664087.1 type II secretion system F family protein [Nocardioides sp. S-58]